MSTATWDQVSGTITSFASKTTVPSSLGDAAGPGYERDPFQGIVTCLGEVAGDLHLVVLGKGGRELFKNTA